MTENSASVGSFGAFWEKLSCNRVMTSSNSGNLLLCGILLNEKNVTKIATILYIQY